MQPSDMVQIIIALITTTGTIFCVVLGKKEEEKQKKSNHPAPPSDKAKVNKWLVGMCICIVLLIANFGILFWRMLEPTPATAITEVKINYPADGIKVDQTEIIKGTSQGVSKTSVVWVVIFVHSVGNYYPQNNPADLQAGGRWSSVAYFGRPQDTGLKYDVLAVLVDKNAQNDFDAYLRTARDKSDYPGLAQLPQGVTIYDRITVTRK